MENLIDQILTVLRTTDSVLISGDFAILYRHRRWHLLTLTYYGSAQGLHTINFMTDQRGHDLAAAWLATGEVAAFGDVSDLFADEVRYKVLPAPEDYLPLLQNRLVDIGGGYTNDAPWSASYQPSKKSAFIEVIAKMMQSGEAGLYLRFNSSCRTIANINAARAA